MQDISFFTPIVYDRMVQNVQEFVTQAAENYFNYGGPAVHVRDKEIVLIDKPLSFTEKCLCILKFLLIFAVIVPLALLVCKIIFNPRHKLTELFLESQKEKSFPIASPPLFLRSDPSLRKNNEKFAQQVKVEQTASHTMSFCVLTTWAG